MNFQTKLGGRLSATTLLTLLAVAWHFLAANPIFAQTRNVDGTVIVGSKAIVSAPTNLSVRSTLSQQQRKWMQILSRPAPGKFRRVQDCSDLINALRDIGLPVFLTQSARDDLLSDDEIIEIDYDQLPVGDLMDEILSSFNATLLMKANRVLIVSKDNELDEEYMQPVTYDVTNWVSDATQANELNFTIRATVEPSSWDNDVGLGSLIHYQRGNRHFLAINQSSRIHAEIHRFLESINQLRGRPVLAGPNIVTKNLGSRVVASRSNPVNSDRRRDYGSSRRREATGGGGDWRRRRIWRRRQHWRIRPGRRRVLKVNGTLEPRASITRRHHQTARVVPFRLNPTSRRKHNESRLGIRGT